MALALALIDMTARVPKFSFSAGGIKNKNFVLHKKHTDSIKSSYSDVPDVLIQETDHVRLTQYVISFIVTVIYTQLNVKKIHSVVIIKNWHSMYILRKDIFHQLEESTVVRYRAEFVHSRFICCKISELC
jgi:hypothetical protein